jgi:YihY family inner membrane protein
MRLIDKPTAYLLRHPVAFFWQTIRAFGNNQGLILAGAVAYYALLSLVPLLILSIVALSHIIDRTELLDTLARYLEWLVPSVSKEVLADVASFVDNQVAISAVLLLTMLFFSSLAFSILEKAVAIIFAHRQIVKSRHLLVSALLPYSLFVLVSVGLLGITLVSVVLQSIAQESVQVLNWTWSLSGVSGLLLYGLGLGSEVFILTILYLVLPFGRTRLAHALLGAVTTTAIWDIIRHGLVWFFTSISKAGIVYGSLTTAVVALFSMEIAAMLLLFGAQVISEYEQLEARLKL